MQPLPVYNLGVLWIRTYCSRIRWELRAERCEEAVKLMQGQTKSVDAAKMNQLYPLHSGQGAALLPPGIENEQLTGINKEPPHATLMPYPTLEQALAARRHGSPFCRTLNGKWNSTWAPSPAERPLRFYRPDYDVSGGMRSRSPPTGSCRATALRSMSTASIRSAWTSRE